MRILWKFLLILVAICLLSTPLGCGESRTVVVHKNPTVHRIQNPPPRMRPGPSPHKAPPARGFPNHR